MQGYLEEGVEVMHDNVASHNCLYQANIKARHEGKVRERKFQVGEFVWRIAPHVWGVVGAIKHKFSPKWEGPYIVEGSTSNRTLLAKGSSRYKGI